MADLDRLSVEDDTKEPNLTAAAASDLFMKPQRGDLLEKEPEVTVGERDNDPTS